jgi:hypothetical protein
MGNTRAGTSMEGSSQDGESAAATNRPVSALTVTPAHGGAVSASVVRSRLQRVRAYRARQHLSAAAFADAWV